jgi:hypothetical protein
MTDRRRLLGGALVMGTVGIATVAVLMAAGPRKGRAEISGFQEIPTLSSPASGSLDLTIAPDDSSISYTLTYDGFTNNVTQSHIHLGRPAFNGGIMVFFCTNLAPPAGVPIPPACPVRGGTVSGTLTAADVLGPAAQGVAAGEFEEVLDALRSEASYVNVHSTTFPGGEIRGQVLFHANGAAIR